MNGRVRVRLQQSHYFIKDAIWIGKYVVVPKTYHSPAVGFKPCCTNSIIGIVSMLTAIGFNNQTVRYTSKIDYKFAKRMLSAEFIALHLAIAKGVP